MQSWGAELSIPVSELVSVGSHWASGLGNLRLLTLRRVPAGPLGTLHWATFARLASPPRPHASPTAPFYFQPSHHTFSAMTGSWGWSLKLEPGAVNCSCANRWLGDLNGSLSVEPVIEFLGYVSLHTHVRWKWASCGVQNESHLPSIRERFLMPTLTRDSALPCSPEDSLDCPPLTSAAVRLSSPLQAFPVTAAPFDSLHPFELSFLFP